MAQASPQEKPAFVVLGWAVGAPFMILCLLLACVAVLVGPSYPPPQLQLGWVVTPKPPQPTVGRIAFASDADGDLDIYAIDADGSNLVQIINDSGDQTNPVWSPNGSRIAYESLATGEIILIDADGSNPTPLTTPLRVAQGGFDWSADSAQIVYPIVDDEPGLALLHIPSGVWHQITVGDDTQPDWSSSGEWIVFVRTSVGASDIYRVRPDGTDLTLVSPGTARANFSAPRWSPDGAQVVLTEGQDIFWIELDGQMMHLTSVPGVTVTGPLSYSPDGMYLVFSGSQPRTQGHDLYVTYFSGGQFSLLYSSAGTVESAPNWGP